MAVRDSSFEPTRDELWQAVEKLFADFSIDKPSTLPETMPKRGLGETAVIEYLAPLVLGGATRLGGDRAMAHMDPPTPWISWVTTLWNASLNQNLLHPDLAPVARKLETRVIDWLAPAFGMDGGHMTPGSTISNLTSLWAAREIKGIKRVLASKAAHLSVPKAAHILGLEYQAIETDDVGRMRLSGLPDDCSECALVLSAGTTSSGAIDPLDQRVDASWLHVDAAWAGPLRFSAQHRHRLDGIEHADSIAFSAHKWLFQPKESGVLLFRNSALAHKAVSFEGAYLTHPNVGLLGSHGAVAVPLLATLLAWGGDGLAERIDRTMALAEALHRYIVDDPRLEVFGPQASGVVLWRAKFEKTETTYERLPKGMASLTKVQGQTWIRQVAANPMADVTLLLDAIQSALRA